MNRLNRILKRRGYDAKQRLFFRIAFNQTWLLLLMFFMSHSLAITLLFAVSRHLPFIVQLFQFKYHLELFAVATLCLVGMLLILLLISVFHDPYIIRLHEKVESKGDKFFQKPPGPNFYQF